MAPGSGDGKKEIAEMPLLTRIGVRLSFFYLFVSALIGVLVLQAKAIGVPAWSWRVWPLHVELMMVGFMIQFPISIAYWVLPKFVSRREREYLAALSLVFLNAGILIHAMGSSGGRVLEGLGILLFLLHGWRRIKPPTPYP